MPLNKPVRRALHHTRQIQCQGFEREDGLWDIEAHMTDVKTHNVDNAERGGYVGAGEPFHDMWMRLTIDRSLKIHQVEAEMDASPFRHCPGIVGRFRLLEGTRIGPGWHRMARDMFSGIQGCTHLHELLTPLATTAVQTLWPLTEEITVEKATERMLDTCHGWSRHSDFVRKYVPHLYVEEETLQYNDSES
ncbi:DUF2889 domain-containing protein [Marinobacterium sediminicola]|uniref:DUF2889 domain-containing protein n=1 Tax=Marinobacterium sediminicola TaxID=518898 RepID=A0ABY1S2F7_9GAMM|nr:DUF2889 domain-containing protein [Marinobacterium sediminicola]ULG70678.1 DUF2889 domain-containing protein [Marinobacterium sediminicola]SMR77212.1 Protein of unknown function [Marinobacterium sediminicola]